ncbi:MAG: HlyD family efflux transporter periplasmic adaptor subunit [bacterium]|nr:HlyD family efflux transporter periplasmic adaptor subunit [bacterium]
MKKVKSILLRLILVVAVLAAGWYSYRFVAQLQQSQREVATTTVRRGDVVVRTYSRGELRAVRQMTLTAPNLFGTVQVTRLAPLGAYARENDLIVEFDDAEVQSRLEEKELELEQIEERIKKSEADLAIRNNQDDVELLRARYAVRRAGLEVQRNELLSKIEARKNELNAEEADRRLEKLKSDILSRRKQAEAELAVLREEKRKAELEQQREKDRLGRVKLLAPMTGLVAIRQQRTSFFFAGTQMPDIREGDELRPGIPVADILDLSELEVVARVGELDRANLTEGQEVVIRLDALADTEVRGKIKSLSGTASADVYSNDPAKKFDVTFEVDMRELLTALGAKPEQIERMIVQAEQNRKRGVGSSGGGGFGSAAAMMAMMGGGGRGGAGGGGGGFAGGGGAGGFPGGGAGGFPGGSAAGGAGGGGGGQRGAGAGGGGRRGGAGGGTDFVKRMLQRLPEDQRKKAQETIDKELDGKKMEDLSQSARRSLMQKIRGLMGGGQGGQRAGRQGGGQGAPGGAAERERQAAAQREQQRIANAKLPPPPEEDSQLDVLLRPGLLADVEIIVEKIPDAVNIPVHAVFEKENKPMVYVKVGNRFEERMIKPLKQSESTMVIAEGLSEGEIVALADPNAKPGEKRRAQPSGSVGGGSPMGGFGGGGGGARGGGGGGRGGGGRR